MQGMAPSSRWPDTQKAGLYSDVDIGGGVVLMADKCVQLVAVFKDYPETSIVLKDEDI